ncbi:hypothetical protein PN36_17475 [Candidatus Thiomargarita nelsonii]|uniref:Uncharacterized protein n=1 Tax=Candidatus Thiomargarita nelsonii TaxID=1003181 RepID=A0A0A6P6G1_9GAMM|nr:hypothetical protein PN36_17475 [Candidatus Thiomargarita nelsonii]
MKSRLKQLGKDSIVYGIGGTLAKAIGFFLLPVYTRLFSPADYGTIEMLIVINSFLGTLLVMGMDSAQSFYFFEQKQEGKPAQARVVSAILQWRLTWGLIIVIGATLLSPFLNALFFSGKLQWIHFVIAFGGAFFVQLVNQSAEVFRLLYRPWAYIGITLGNTAISAAVAITLIVWLDYGILGFFIGPAIGSLIFSLIGWWAIRDYLDWSIWHRNWWPKLLHFGVPLVPAGLAMYVMNTADRWFIIHYHGEDALGFYAVGAKFALLLALVIETFRKAWWPVAMDAMHSPDGPALYRAISRLYLGIGAAGVVLLTAISPLLVSWLTAPAFHGAYLIVGVLAWHSVFYGFFLISAAGIWKAEKTKWMPILMGIAAIINLILDTLLVPKYGGLGAAAATSVSFFIWNVMTILLSEKLWKVSYNLWILGGQVAIGVAATTIILMLQIDDAPPMHILIVAAITAIFLAASGIRWDQYHTLFQHAKLYAIKL